MGNPGCAGTAATLDDRTRDACLHRLGDQYAAGLLTDSELESRIQIALAAETEADLAVVMEDVAAAASAGQVGEHRPADRPDPHTRTAHLLRWGGGILVLAAGGLLLAVVGPGSNVVEFAVGLAVGLLGFLTHWWLSSRSVRPMAEADEPSPVVRPSAPVLRDVDWRDADDVEPLPVPVVDHEEAPMTRLRSIRPVGRGNGGIPVQRSGD